MMRHFLIITYFSLLILVILGIGSLSAQVVYERDGNRYHQNVFGFRMEIPEDWQIGDDGRVSLNGDYLISFGPDLDDGARIYFSFFPVKGLSLSEFADESLLEFMLQDSIAYEEVKIGNLQCLVSRQSMSSIPTKSYPDLTSVFSRMDDHFFRAFFFSYDKNQRDEVLDILRSIRFDKKMKKLSFLAVKDYQNYGSRTALAKIDEMYVMARDPSIPQDIDLSDGTETIIYDDFEYPTRFPAGEHTDEYGQRIQYYVNGRYHVDNRGKSVDVFIPDIRVNARNFAMSIDMRFEGGSPQKGNGLVFRGGDTGFYLFNVSPDCDYAVYKYLRGFESVVPKTHTEHASFLESNRLKIMLEENRLRAFINHEPVKSISLGDDHDSGYVGLYVSAGSWVSFEDYYLEIND